MQFHSQCSRWILAFFSAAAGLALAQAPPLLISGVEVGSRNERTALIRTTGRLSSSVDVKVKNTGDRPLLPPLHAVIAFTPLQGGNLAGLTMPGTLGGLGKDPYQTFFKDLSAAIGDGLAAGAETTFNFTFERPQATSVSYAIAIHSNRNRDPVAVIGGPYSGQQGVAVRFDASGSTDPDGDALTFGWDFGDGGTASGAAPEHAYAATGLFTVTLTVRDARGAVVTRETQVPLAPAGVFALARTRTLDGNGHPLGEVTIEQTGPDGARTLRSDAVSGFSSLGGAPGAHSWRFERPGYLTSYRKTTLSQGQVKVVAFPWLAALSTQRTPLSLLNPTVVESPGERVVLTFPPEAFGQVESVAITELNGQTLPLPLPVGWSPLAAFQVDFPGEAGADVAASLKLLQPLAAGQSAAFIRLDAAGPAWLTEALVAGAGSDTVALVLRQPGSYAVVLEDTLPAGNPAVAVAGQPLPAGGAPVISAEVTAVGAVNPGTRVASLDPARVTAAATVDFTNGSQPLASGAWFLAEVEETYDLTDGRALKTPDYDATFYVYQHPGDAAPATATATFPLRPRILFGPEQLTEAHIRVAVLKLNQFSGGILTPDGGLLSLAGVQLGVPAGAVGSAAAAEIRLLSTTSLTRFLGGFQALLAFDLNLPALAAGTALNLTLTQKLAPDSQFVLARCVGSGTESGLQPVLRLRSDAQGTVTSAEPASGPRLPGIAGSGQYVIVRIAEAEALISGLVRQTGGAALPGALVRVSAEPWLSLTGQTGTFFTLAKPGVRVVTGADPVSGDSGQATATLADADATASVEIQTAPTGPRVVASTPAANDAKAATVTPITVEFSEPVQPGSFGANGVLLREVGANSEVPGSLSLDLTNRKATLLPLNPLSSGTDYEIRVSAAILDRQGLPIEGPLSFPFKTAPSAERPQGAQLVIYQPDAVNVPPAVLAQLVGYDAAARLSMVVATGSPGTADPEVPVILVNENTGETATVLSKPDGSFASFIRAGEEDFINAVFVNANGTRVEVPATRQLFDSGQIGLYKYGGILEAEGDGGPVQVLIKPQAIAQRTVFKLEGLPLAEMEQLLAGNLPLDGTLVGGLRMQALGDALKEPAKVMLPFDPVAAGLPGGTVPPTTAFVLTKVVELDGGKQYEVLDDMKFADGAIRTNSPPFSGLLDFALNPGGFAVFAAHMVANGQTIVGRVVRVPEAVVGLVQNDTIDQFKGVPGAIVTGNGRSNNRPGFQPGAFVAKANLNGFYTLMIPRSLDEEVLSLKAESALLPGRVALGLARAGFSLGPWIGNLVFAMPPTANGDDSAPPIVRVQPPSATLPVNQTFRVEVILVDESSPCTVSRFDWVRPDSLNSPRSVALTDGVTLAEGDVEISEFAGPTAAPAEGVTRKLYDIKVKKAALLALQVEASDAAGNLATAKTVLTVNSTASPVNPDETAIASDPNDTTRPVVIGVDPQHGQKIGGTQPIRIRFSEAMSGDALTAIGVSLAENGGTAIPFVRVLSPDRLTLSLFPSALPTGKTVNVSVSGVTDLSANLVTPFSSTFSTLAAKSVDLEGTDGAAGAVLFGGCAYVLDRARNRLLVHSLSTGSAGLGGNETLAAGRILAEAPLPSFPRAIALLPQFDYKLRADANPSLPSPAKRGMILAITGGLAGDIGIPPWLRLYDVADPAAPVRLATSFLTSDFTAAASVVKFGSGHAYLGIQTFEGIQLLRVGLQAQIIGAHAAEADFVADSSAGVDLTGDGDYVDAGEILPKVGRAEFWGSQLVGFEGQRTLTDLAVSGNHYLAICMPPKKSPGPPPVNKPGEVKILLFDGAPVAGGAAAGIIPFPAGTEPRRIEWLPEFQVESTAGIRTVRMALAVGLDDRIDIYDVSFNPEVPLLVQRIELGGLVGSVRTMGVAGFGRFAVGGSTGQALLDLRQMGRVLGPNGELAAATTPAFFASAHPSVSAFFKAAAPGRGLSLGPAGAIGLGPAGYQFLLAPPALQLARMNPGVGVINPDDIAAGATLPSFESLTELLGGIQLESLVVPAHLTSYGDDVKKATAVPPPVEQHNYLLIEASGALGDEIGLTVETLGRGGKRLPPRGKGFAPVVLTGRAETYNAAPPAQPQVTPLKAFRLTSELSSPFYNVFLSSPFLMIREAYGDQADGEVKAFPGRSAIQVGQQLRVSFETTSAEVPEGFTNTTGDDPPSGASFLLPTFCADYVGSANPRVGQSAPVVDGVNLQSGEFAHTATDCERPGKGVPLVLTRTYNSQAHYAGAFGRNWITNYDALICEIPADRVPSSFRLPLVYYNDILLDEMAAPGDVILREPNGDMRRFQAITAANGNLAKKSLFDSDPMIPLMGWTNKIGGFYESAPGVYDVLYKFKDATFVLVDVFGGRRFFDAEGKLTRAVSPYQASALRIDHLRDGRLRKVTGDTGQTLEFGYFMDSGDEGFESGLDKTLPAGNQASYGLVARVKSPDGELKYTYDTNALLTTFEGPGGTITYGYTEAPRFQLKAIGRADGSKAPAQKITYGPDGLVTETESNGVVRTYAGSKATAAERFTAGDNTQLAVKLKNVNQAHGQLVADARGRVTGSPFGNYTHNSEGEVTAVTPKSTGGGELAAEAVVATFDKNNPVYRFRGNLLSVAQGTGATASTASYTYDNSAWNRRLTETSPNGIVRQWTHEDFTGGELTKGPNKKVTLTVGPVVQVTAFNDFGTMTRQTSTEGAVSFEQTTQFDPDGLVVGHRRGSGAGAPGAMTGTYAGDSLQSLQRGATAVFTPEYDAGSGRIAGLNGEVAGMPSLTFGMNDQTGRPTSVKADSGTNALEETFTYDTAHPDLVKTLTRKDAGLPDQVITYSYDAVGRPTSYTHHGNTINLRYHGATLIGQDGPGFKTRTILNGEGIPVSIEENGITTTYDGFDTGSRLKGWKSAGAHYENIHDAKGVLTGRTIRTDPGAAQLLAQTFTHDGAGRVKTVVCDGSTWSYDYFPDGAIRKLSLASAEVQEIERDAAGRITAEEWFDGQVRASYSGFHEFSGVPDSQTYRFPGNRTRVHDLTLDDLGRVTAERIGTVTTGYEYDDFGNVKAITDPDGVRQEWTYSPGGVPLGRKFGDGKSITYTYDAGFLLTGEGQITRTYNAANQPATITNPDGSTTEFEDYNTFFAANRVTDRGFTIDRTFTDGRLTQLRSGVDTIGLGYDGLGRMTTADRAGWAVAFGYDPRFGRDRETSPLGTWQLTHGSGGEVVREKYPSGLALSFTNNPLRLPSAITDYVSEITWADVGIIDKVTYPGGLTVKWGFDAQLRPNKVELVLGDSLLDGRAYELSPGGRVLSEQNLATSRFDVFTHNPAADGMRVTAAKFGAGNAQGAEPLEQIGGIAFAGPNSEIDLGSLSAAGPRRGIAPGPGDSLTSDAEGRVTAGPVWLPSLAGPVRVNARFHYDMNYRLVRVERLGSGGAVEVTINYVRDALNRIVRRTVAGPASLCTPGTWNYAWRDRDLIEEYQVIGDAPQLLRRYVYGGDQLLLVEAAAQPGGALQRYVPLVGLTGCIHGYYDLSGNRVTDIDYSLYGLPFIGGTVAGQPFGAVSTTLLFHGAFFDVETGLYDMGERTLHPVFARFLQIDSALYESSRALHLAFNGDPATNIDPAGAAADSAAEGKRPGFWMRTHDVLVKGGLKANAVTLDLPGGNQFALSKNSKGLDFASKALKLAAGLLPEEIAAEVEKTSKTLTGGKYILEALELRSEWKKKKDDWQVAVKTISNLDAAMKATRGGATLSFDDFADRVARDVDLRQRHFGNLAGARNKAWIARLDLVRSRVGAAKTISGVSSFLLNKLAKAQKSDNDRLMVAGLAAEFAAAATDFADLALRGAAGTAAGNAEISIAGGYLKGAAAGRMMRFGSVMQAYDLGFAGGKAGFALALSAVDPGAARLYLQDVATFEKNGGYFNAHGWGGMLGAATESSVGSQLGLGVASQYYGRKLGYNDLTDAIRNFADWHPSEPYLDLFTGRAPVNPIQIYYNGLDAP